MSRTRLTSALAAALLVAIVPAAHAELDWPEKVELGAALYEIRGHLDAVETNLGGSFGSFASESFMAEAQHAVAHAGHPIAEVYPAISPTVREIDSVVDDTLRDALEKLNARVGQGVTSYSEIADELSTARWAVDMVQTATLGVDSPNDPALNAAIAAQLIELSTDEYDEAILDSRVEYVVELQDAYAFLDVAHMDILRGATFMDYSATQQIEYDDAFLAFYEVYDNRADPARSAEMASALSAKLVSTFAESDGMMGMTDMTDMADKDSMMPMQADYAESVARIAVIRDLLDQAKYEYNAGNTDMAADLVKQAYIDEFEYVESDLDAVGQPELREKIETMLRDTILSSIRAGGDDAPPMIDTVVGDLEVARVALSGEGEPMMTSESEGGGCLIATAAYGTEMAHEVQALRETRDSVLGTATGSAFMSAFNGVYYAFSPTVADWERESPEFRALVRALITPMVASLSIMSVAGDDASDIGVASLGALVIALNVGMYVAAPAAIAWRLRR